MADEYIRKADAIKQCGFGMTSLHIANILRAMRPADVAPVVHGKWIKQYRGQVNSICSVCGKEVGRLTDFCPYCGAKMDEE